MSEHIVMLSTDWESSVDPTGFWMSEKLDGILALWDGEKLMTRSGNTINVPDWFISSLPQDRLLGELFLGRQKFPETLSVVRRARPRPLDWARVTYRVFDAPDVVGPFESRMYFVCQTLLSIQDIWRGAEKPKFAPRESPILVVNQTVCASRAHLDEFHRTLVTAGAEGTMLRRPKSPYRVGRSADLLRRKDWFTEEARVVGHNYNPDGFRSLQCQLLSDPNITFDVGSGLDASLVRNPPKEGAIITVKYKSRTDSGRLREPSFICVRDYE